MPEPRLHERAEWIDADVQGDVAERVARTVTIDGCVLRGVRFTGSELANLRLSNCVFESCELSGVLADEVEVSQVEFRDCRMDGFAGGRGRFDDVLFTRCRMPEASFRLTKWDRSEIIDCYLRRADFSGSTFAHSSFLGDDLTEALFWRATMTGVRLHGSTLAGVRGGTSFRGVRIGDEQVDAVARAVFEDLDVRIGEADDA